MATTRQRTQDGRAAEAAIRLGKTGTFTLELGGFILRNCRTEVVDGEAPACTDFPWLAQRAAEGWAFACRNRLGTWRMLVRPVDGGLAVRLSGRIARASSRLLLRPLVCPRLSVEHVLEHGRRMGGCHSMLTANLAAERRFTSCFMGLLTSQGRTLLLSHALQQRDLSEIRGLAVPGQVRDLTVESDLDWHPAGAVEAEEVTLRASADGFPLMESWAEANVEARREPAPVKPGWNSWDYYRWTITEDEVLENAGFIAADPVLSKRIKRIIVDDGWQYCYGEWEANPLFPGGMQSLASKITKLGFEPGLWIAPTIVEPHARIAQLDSGMLARGVSDLPCLAFSCMKRFGFVFDPTRPEVNAWLHSLFARYADMGYRYFKLDFLGTTLKAPRFADPTVGKGEIIRRIVEPIRRATLGRAVILGCNNHFEAGNACVDAVRVSSDIGANWRSIRENAFSIAARFWSNRRFWTNDPDFTLCRGPDTSDDPDLTRLRALLPYVEPDKPDQFDCDRSLVSMREPEVRVLLSLVLMAAGAVNISDKVSRLNRTGLALARKAVSAEVGETGIPLDLFRADHPALWLQRLSGGRARALMVNWSDAPRSLVLDLAAHGAGGFAAARDFWEDRPVAVRNGRLECRLPAHSCQLVELG